MVGKQSREKFPPKASHQAKAMFELIHTNICGPLFVSSMSRLRYFITFNNDCNKWAWTYFMKTKSEALNIFKRFKQEMEVESGKQVKMFHFDRGGEYNSKEFEKYCHDRGIKHQFIQKFEHFSKTKFQKGRTKQSWTKLGACCLKACTKIIVD
jgi:transposase InsO family protein